MIALGSDCPRRCCGVTLTWATRFGHAVCVLCRCRRTLVSRYSGGDTGCRGNDGRGRRGGPSNSLSAHPWLLNANRANVGRSAGDLSGLPLVWPSSLREERMRFHGLPSILAAQIDAVAAGCPTDAAKGQVPVVEVLTQIGPTNPVASREVTGGRCGGYVRLMTMMNARMVSRSDLGTQLADLLLLAGGTPVAIPWHVRWCPQQLSKGGGDRPEFQLVATRRKCGKSSSSAPCEPPAQLTIGPGQRLSLKTKLPRLT